MLAAVVFFPAALVAEEPGLLRLEGKSYAAVFSRDNGSLLSFGPAGGGAVFSGGPRGLWSAQRLDGYRIVAAEFGTHVPGRTFASQPAADGRSAELVYSSDQIEVVVTLVAGDDALDVTARVTPRADVLLEFALPAQLRFDPDHLVRLVCPGDGNYLVGLALRGEFFDPHPDETTRAAGPRPRASDLAQSSAKTPAAKPPPAIVEPPPPDVTAPGQRGEVPGSTTRWIRRSSRNPPRAGRYYQHTMSYPPAFADFFHFETLAGTAAVYRVQPRNWEPWQGATDPQAIFVPGRLACGGDEEGGWCDRAFGVHVPAGKTWQSPLVRLAGGGSAPQRLADYARFNGIQRTLEQKLPPPTLAKFKQSVLVLLPGTAEEKRAALPRLPVPSLIHFTDYLYGGFDKQYPDHLPPAAGFGTVDEFRRFLDEARRAGHLVSPYTNPTWWCDKPRGPTFVAAGETPLLRTLDGRLSRERYGTNEGFTVCHWHPAVRAANRRTIEQFAAEFPVDLLFQDQCGARTWRYDLNRASPNPLAYAEGLLSMVGEDSRRVPLATESGWDRMLNDEVQLCGMTWKIVPNENPPSWVRPLKSQFDPACWEVFPLAQYLGHDKVLLVHHDLGQFVTNRPMLAWTLGLGYGMSYRVGATEIDRPAQRQWLLWLDRLQKSVVARYLGRPLDAFCHERGPRPSAADDGLMTARYGDVQVTANLGPQARQAAGYRLAPFGFWATAPGMVAGNLASVGGVDQGEAGVSFVVQRRSDGHDVWVYAAAEEDVGVVWPAGGSAPKQLLFEGAAPVTATGIDGVCRFRLPAQTDRPRVVVPAEFAEKAPRDWPGPRPAVGVLDFGRAHALSWSKITPAHWLKALRQSPLATQYGLAVQPIATAKDLDAALRGDPQQFLAIINPYGERFPTIAPAAWRETLQRIRDYVEHGGQWWETAGHSFHIAVWESPDEAGKILTERVGPAGLSCLEIGVGGGEIDRPAERVLFSSIARRWLGEELLAELDPASAIVNRGLPREQHGAAHLSLLAADQSDYIGGYRLAGWGWLWRIGGFWPEPKLVLPVVLGVLEHTYTHPPEPVRSGGIKHLWHATTP